MCLAVKQRLDVTDTFRYNFPIPIAVGAEAAMMTTVAGWHVKNYSSESELSGIFMNSDYYYLSYLSWRNVCEQRALSGRSSRFACDVLTVNVASNIFAIIYHSDCCYHYALGELVNLLLNVCCGEHHC